MRKKVFISIFLVFVNAFCFAHEHWIDLETFEPQVGQKIKVFVKSGHNFPKGELVLNKRFLKEIKLITPDKNTKSYELEQEKDARTTYIVFDTTGSYVLYFSVTRPPEDEEVYFGKSVVSIKERSDVISEVGSKLEIVSKQTNIQLNKKAVFQVLFDKKPIKTTVSVSIEGKKNFFVQTDKNGVFYLDIKHSGRYLLTTSYKKYGCSLTFFLRTQK